MVIGLSVPSVVAGQDRMLHLDSRYVGRFCPLVPDRTRPPLIGGYQSTGSVTIFTQPDRTPVLTGGGRKLRGNQMTTSQHGYLFLLARSVVR